MTTALDLVQGGLLNLNAYAPGQALSSTIAQVGLTALNDLLDSLSTDQAFVFTQNENVVQWTPGTFKYTVGNPVGGTFTGYTIAGQGNIVGVTSVVPISFGYNGTAGQYKGGNLTDTASAIPSTATLYTYNAGSTSAITFTAPPTGTTRCYRPHGLASPGTIWSPSAMGRRSRRFLPMDLQGSLLPPRSPEPQRRRGTR